MDYIKIIAYLQSLPKVGKILCVCIVALVAILLLFFTSCGTVKTTINNSDGNSIEVNSSPSTSVTTQLDSLTLKLK